MTHRRATQRRFGRPAAFPPAVAAVVLSLLAAVAVRPASAAPAPDSLLAALAVPVAPAHPREFIFTDKGAAHLCGEAVGENDRAYHGFAIAMHELLDGWTLRLEDGTLLSAATAESAVVRPDRLVRYHRLPGGGTVTETVTLWDRADAFGIVYEGVPPGRFAFVPRLDMRFIWRVPRPTYRTEWRAPALLAARADRLSAADGRRDPPWLAIRVEGADDFAAAPRYVPCSYAKGRARRAMDHATPWEPGGITGRIPPYVPAATVTVTVAAAADAGAAAARAAALAAAADSLAAARRARLAAVADPARLSTGDPRTDRALAWARVSLDALVMNQRGPGIYAGFYWFTTYWGRDTFIVLPGAMAAGLPPATAREILAGFAAWQDTTGGPRDGRLPNFVTVDQVQYASADATWWFARALERYWRRTGDDTFARAMAPVVWRACDGALAHAVDGLGLLTHGDGETWMDAGGEQHPHSPRGDRAVEIQALFQRGLRLAARLAERFPDLAAAGGGDAAARIARYRGAAARTARALRERFWVGGRLVDHLNADGTPDAQVRPNTLLALLAAPDLFTAPQRRAVVAAARSGKLVTPWGVRSLAPDDPQYHPRHLWLDRYHYDAAYHNGDVWLWLSGPWISALPDPRDGLDQVAMLVDEILDRGAVGTLREIRDGDPAPPGKDEFGGATSQAWSLSELLRVMSDDFLGLDVDLAADPPRVTVRPALPAVWPRLAAAVRIGERTCRITVTRDGGTRLAWDRPPPPAWRIAVDRR